MSTGDKANTVILATSNGAGMGHLARQSAVAMALRDRVRPTIFSLSTAVHVVAAQGLTAEYCPSHHRGWMPHEVWHRYLGSRIDALLSETGAKVLAFDGVAPYLGMLRTRQRHKDVAFVWVRRGLWRESANHRLLRSAAFFDDVVEPGDIAADTDRGPTSKEPAIRLSPIGYRGPWLSRAAAAEALGLDPNRPTALVTLGAGTINDALTPSSAAVFEFLRTQDWQVAVTRAPLARGSYSAQDARVHQLVDIYPIARYLNAFDAAVSAAGYNAVHELLPARVPTLFVPNASTATDDQVARAAWVAKQGLALYSTEDPRDVAEGVRRLLDPGLRAALGDACSTLDVPTGSVELADHLVSLTRTFGGHRPTAQEGLQSRSLAAKAFAMRVLGAGGVSAIRKALGRNPVADGPRRPLDIRPVVTDELDPAVLRAGHPVEHLLPGTSALYRTRRLAIAHTAYSWPASAGELGGKAPGLAMQ